MYALRGKGCCVTHFGGIECLSDFQMGRVIQSLSSYWCILVGMHNCIYLLIHCCVPNIIGIVGSVPWLFPLVSMRMRRQCTQKDGLQLLFWTTICILYFAIKLVNIIKLQNLAVVLNELTLSNVVGQQEGGGDYFIIWEYVVFKLNWFK